MKVLVTIPNRGWVHRQVLAIALQMVAERECELVIDPAIHPPPYDNCLNILARKFYLGDYDFWMNIDHDNPPTKNPLELIKLDKDIIGLPTPGLSEFQNPMVHPMAFRIVDGKHVPVRDGKGLERVDAISSGAMLIKKRVFDNEMMRRFPFLSVYNEYGIRTHGPDIAFCSKARSQGFEIYSHFDYPCYHYKDFELGELMGRL